MPAFTPRNETVVIPPLVRDTLMRYIEFGIPTGGFLEAVLSNDLFEAMGRADSENRHQIFEIVSWIYNYAPGNCHGSRQIYNNWIAEGGLSGRQEKEEEEE